MQIQSPTATKHNIESRRAINAESEEKMMNFKRLFVVENGESGGWTNSTKTSFIIAVEDDELKVTCISGRDMYAAEINTAFGRFLLEYQKEVGKKVETYRRTNRYRFAYRQGSSGCQDTFIEIDKGDGFPQRRFLMHQSCFGKNGGFKAFVYDFLDLCVASGFLVIEDGCYVYHEEEDAYAADLHTRIVKPRLVEYEEGWSEPWARPTEVVYLRTCREAPEKDGGEQSPSEEEYADERSALADPIEESEEEDGGTL